ncbi:FtsX-like permease family protein [Microbacterium sp. PMB16]|uniref:FtsX-like permease family protein n=1 Tax=Microbacterium sp. PMB16 TaxID=3120157 RepID=UPI003F4B308B
MVLSDLRHSWRIWVGALLLIALTQLIAGWMGAIMAHGFSNQDVPATRDLAKALSSAAGTCGFILALTIIGSIRSITSLVVYQRRRLLALWQLAGMTDRQVSGIVTLQLLTIGVIASVIGGLLGLASIGGVIDYVAANGLSTPQMTRESLPAGVLWGLGAGLLTVVVSARMLNREIRKVQALDALRAVGFRDQRMTVGRWITTALILAAVGGLVALILQAKKPTSSFGLLIFVMLLLLAAVSAAGPIVVIPVMRAWTALVPPARSACWLLARRTLLTSTARAISSVVPVAIAFILVVGLYSCVETVAAVHNAQGSFPLFAMILLIGLPLLVSLSAAAVMVFMTGQQREREIALSALAGATPAQQFLQAIFEAVIVVVTGALIGLVCVLATIAALQPSIISATGGPIVRISWVPMIHILAFVLATNLIATLLPTFASQRKNSARILVA